MLTRSSGTETLARKAEATLARVRLLQRRHFVGDRSAACSRTHDAITVPPLLRTRSLFERLREGSRIVLPIGPAQAQDLEFMRAHEATRF